MKLLATALLILNGQPLHFDEARPYLESNILMVPLRAVAEKMSAQVHYSPTTSSITIRRGERTIELAVGQMNAYANGRSVGLDLPARLRAGRVFVPARFVAEALGAQVRWDSARRTAHIMTNSVPTPPSTPRQAPVTVQLLTDKQRYALGETVRFTVFARNTSGKPQKLTFHSGKRFDVRVYRAGETDAEEVWSAGHGRMYTMEIRTLTIAPGQVMEFSHEWNQTGNDGRVLPRGEYSVTGEINAQNLQAATPRTIVLSD